MAAPFTVRLDDELRLKLEREAKADDRSISYMVQKAVETFVDARERRRAVIMASYEAALAEKEFISGEAMDAWVESWGTEAELPPPKADIFRS